MHKADCIFCKIASKEIPSSMILEDSEHMAFLSHRPNTEGFTVVISKEHYGSYFAEVPSEVRARMLEFASKTAKLLDDTFEDVGRTGLMFEGFGVDHLHCKLFPMHGTKGDKWAQHASQKGAYFEQYQGFISSHDYGEPGRPEIDETWRKFQPQV